MRSQELANLTPRHLFVLHQEDFHKHVQLRSFLRLQARCSCFIFSFSWESAEYSAGFNACATSAQYV